MVVFASLRGDLVSNPSSNTFGKKFALNDAVQGLGCHSWGLHWSWGLIVCEHDIQR